MYAFISPGGAGRERLFFVPSLECHNKGKEFVVKIVDILVNKTISEYWRDDSLQKVYEDDCLKMQKLRKNIENIKLNRRGKISTKVLTTTSENETKTTIITQLATIEDPRDFFNISLTAFINVIENDSLINDQSKNQ